MATTLFTITGNRERVVVLHYISTKVLSIHVLTRKQIMIPLRVLQYMFFSGVEDFVDSEKLFIPLPHEQNLLHMRNDLSEYDWSNVKNIINVDAFLNVITTTINNNCFLRKVGKRFTKTSPWITPDLLRNIKRKNQL